MIFLVFVFRCAGSNLCDRLITRSEESCCVFFIVRGLETLEIWRPRPDVDCYAAETKKRSLRNFKATELFGKTFLFLEIS